MKFSLPMLPSELEFQTTPAEWHIESTGELVITAGAKTDLFFPPDGGAHADNAPAALFSTSAQNFTLSARVQVAFASTYDAGALQIRAAEDVWGKLCFEYSPQGQPMVVSVVTRGVSDDCNSVVIQGNVVYLRIARIGQTFAFHYSFDGNHWEFVRHFGLGAVDELQIGFSSQSPTGQGCEARFSAIQFQAYKLGDLRSGE